ncbi:MAG: plasmid recombination protein, partial [Bacteroidales bacterium]|nr:plasmid recombination protein [Bacteroidales bacterium]
GQAVEEYNAKQKRADRRIDGAKGYMEQIRNSKNGEKLFYENVVQVGNKFDCAVGTENGELAKKALNDYMQDFQRRNPNLYVFNAVLHMDEATPHLHIDYIPLAHGYQRGLQVRNSLDKALKEQGIDGKVNKKENSTHNWQEAEKTALEGFMRAYGLERAEERGLKRDHMSIDQYKAVAEQIHNEVREIPKQIETAPMMLNKERVSVKKTDLEALEQRARLSLVHEKATKELQKGMEKSQAEGKQYITNKMSLSLMNLDSAEKALDEAQEERKKAVELRQKAEKMVKAQEELNERYKNLYGAYTDQQKTIATQKDKISALTAENTSLKAQIADLRQSIEERVQKAVEPLKKQIESLTEHLQGMARSLTNVVKAVGMLKYHKGDYKAELTDKQGEIVDAVAEYAKHWIEQDLGNCQETEVMKAEIDSEVELTKGIKQYMSPDYPDLLYYKGGQQGRGFYSKEGRYYGNLDIMPELQKQGVTIKDPYELLPGRGRGR